VNGEGFEVGKNSAAIYPRDPAASDANIQRIGNFDPPQLRDNGSGVGNQIE
jgi:hypothetical protein